MIRELKGSDTQEANNIYRRFYSGNEYPNFQKLNQPFVVTNNDNEIVVVGGLKLIAEAVFVTDRRHPVRVRLNALIQALGSTIFIARELGHDQIHAFVNNDETYVKAMKRYGFAELNAKLLVLNCGESDG